MITIRGRQTLLVEAHAHVWDRLDGRRLDTKRHTPVSFGRTKTGEETNQFLPPEFADVRSPIETFELYMELLGIDKAVLLQNPCYGQQYDYVNEIMRRHPGKFASVGVPDPQNKESYLRTAKQCLAGGYGYKALKFEHPDIPFAMTAPENAFVFETLLEYGAYFMMDMGWGKGPHDYPIDDLAIIAKRYPDLTIVLPHFGVSRLWDENEHRTGYPSLKKTLDLLEVNGNIWFDTAGVNGLVNQFEEYPYPALGRILKVVGERGALNRVMWGSDYPSALRFSTYRQMRDALAVHCDFLSDDQMADILGRTAERVWFS